MMTIESEGQVHRAHDLVSTSELYPPPAVLDHVEDYDKFV